jgi:hypothetical protein
MDTAPRSHCFISYSQKDKPFVQRLAVDLREASLPVQFDEWSLRAGDSLLDRIASLIGGAFVVICVVSRHSIRSKWVATELQLAHERNLPVLAIAIDDAFKSADGVSRYFSDVLVVDASASYYPALRRIIERVRKDVPQSPAARSRSKASKPAPARLHRAIDSGDVTRVRDIVIESPHVVLQLFRRWAVNECIGRPNLDGREWDALIVNGQSGRYDCVLLHFAETSIASRTTFNNCIQEARDLSRSPHLSDAIKRIVALRLRSGYGAHQILEWDHRPINLSHMILHGRRAEYSRADNDQRLNYHRQYSIEIASYDRLLNSKPVETDLD